MAILESIVILLCACWSSYFLRQVGGGPLGVKLQPKGLAPLLNGVIVLPIVISVLVHFGILYAIAALFWSALWLNTGHATAYDMGRDPSIAQSGRKEFLSHVVDPICNLLGWPLGGTKYCWLFMGLKGLLVGLPTLIVAPLFVVLYPLGYDLGYRFPLCQWFNQHIAKETGTFTSEWYAGFMIGFLGGLSIFTKIAFPHLL